MDKIIAKGLTFQGCHGVLDEERYMPQEFQVDITLFLDLQKAGQSDDITDTVDYASVYEDVRHMVEKQSFQLIEALAQHLADHILKSYAVHEVEVVVYKPHPPKMNQIDYFAVALTRSKE